MSGGGGGAPQMMFLPSQQTTTNQLPQWVQDAGKANYDAASGMSPAAFQPYQFGRVANMNDVQYGALNSIAANAGQASKGYEAAAALANQGLQNASGIMGNAVSGMYNAMNPASVQQSINKMNDIAGQGIGGANYTQGQYNQIQYGTPGYDKISAGNAYYSPIDYNANPATAGMNAIYNQFNPSTGLMNNAQQAINNTLNAANQANQIGNVNAQNVTAQSLPQGDISQYMNPYTQNVIDSSMATLDQQRKQSLNSNADQAINAKAFGGSRAAIQDAVTNSQYGLQGAQLAANLNNQNFNQAQSAMQADQARNLQAQLANQQANLQAATTNQGKDLNVANLGLGAANQQGNLGLNASNALVNAGQTYGQLGLQSKGQDITAQQANMNAALQNRGQNLDAAQANLAAQLQSRGQDITAQQANMNAALTDQMNSANVQNNNIQNVLQNRGLSLNALQNAGNLGLQNANMSLNALNNIAGIGQNYGALNNQTAQLTGSLIGQQQSDYLNSQNAALAAGNQIQNQNQNLINADMQRYADYQNSLLAPLNLRMQALGMTPYNTSTNTSGFTSQTYQPTSSSLGSTLGGLGLMGLSAFGNAGLPGGGTVLGGLLGRGLGLK